MKVAILAGGKGTRLAEETHVRPKPMVEIGGKPILWHIMKTYAYYGFKNFVIALGYKGEYIKRYFVDLCHMSKDLTVNCDNGHVQVHEGNSIDWTVQLIDTGIETLTGGRIKRLAPYIGDETFMLTWGDGVSDIDLENLLRFHRSHGKLATLTAVRPTARYGHLDLVGNQVAEFSEKPQTKEGWINGAFFILEPGIFDYIDGDMTQWEREPMERLARDGQLMAYKHKSFWQCMDTFREKHILEGLWRSGRAPWKVWDSPRQSARTIHDVIYAERMPLREPVGT
ncbi:MAG: glucose-1-phosphate cytidylyltransferase [Phycisphaerales bacterium]|nr:MAG: glucose-1-phosphate cytidylyltransferase [Phycisphaerales bacterium]